MVFMLSEDTLLRKFKKELDIIKYKVQFIWNCRIKRIINNKKKQVLVDELEQSNRPELGDNELNYDFA